MVRGSETTTKRLVALVLVIVRRCRRLIVGITVESPSELYRNGERQLN